MCWFNKNLWPYWGFKQLLKKWSSMELKIISVTMILHTAKYKMRRKILCRYIWSSFAPYWSMGKCLEPFVGTILYVWRRAELHGRPSGVISGSSSIEMKPRKSMVLTVRGKWWIFLRPGNCVQFCPDNFFFTIHLKLKSTYALHWRFDILSWAVQSAGSSY